MQLPQTDHYTDRGETFVFRSGIWTTEAGMCVSTIRGAELTQKFYQHHGRSPLNDDPPVPKRPTRKSELAKAKAVRAAIAKALSTRPPPQDV